MKKTKRLISLMLSLTLILSIFSAAIITADGATVEKYNEDYEYRIVNDEYVEILEYFHAGDVVIPETIDGYPVTVIGTDAFYETDITSVVIPNTVTFIESCAFGECYKLKSITIPDSVVGIDGYAFYETAIETLTVPGYVRYFGHGVFKSCTSLKSVTFSDGATRVPEDMFLNCTALKEVNLPEGISTIGETAFAYCSSLKNIKLPDTLRSISKHAFTSTGIKKIKLPSSTYLFNKSIGFKYKRINGKLKAKAMKNFTIVGSGTNQINYFNNINYANKNGFKMVIKLDTTKTNKVTAYAKQKFKLKLSGGQSVKKWKSSNKKIATVNQNGKVKTLKKGKTTITAKVNSKTTVKCKVTVKKSL